MILRPFLFMLTSQNRQSKSVCSEACTGNYDGPEEVKYPLSRPGTAPVQPLLLQRNGRQSPEGLVRRIDDNAD